MARSFLFVFLAALSVLILAADAPRPADSGLDAQKGQLAKLQGLVGSWKGVASPIRGSTKNSWVEKADWAWKFSGKSASLAVQIGDSKYFSTAELQPGKKA